MLDMQNITHDPLVAALIRLCDRVGGHEAVARATGLNKDNLWQIVNGIRLPSGNPRGVGPKVRAALSSAFPGWLDPVTGATDQPSDLAVIAPMNLRQTLERLAYFLGESPPDKREIIGSMLDRLAKHPHDKATIDLMLPWMTRAPD